MAAPRQGTFFSLGSYFVRYVQVRHRHFKANDLPFSQFGWQAKRRTANIETIKGRNEKRWPLLENSNAQERFDSRRARLDSVRRP